MTTIINLKSLSASDSALKDALKEIQRANSSLCIRLEAARHYKENIYKDLFKAMGENTSITSLELDIIKLSTGYPKFAEYFKNITHLRINIKGTNLQGLRDFMMGLQQVSHLEIAEYHSGIDLSGKILVLLDVCKFLNGLTSLTLKNIYISNTTISNPRVNFNELLSEIIRSNKLKSLAFHGTSLGSSSWSVLIDALAQQTSLESIYLPGLSMQKIEDLKSLMSELTGKYIQSTNAGYNALLPSQFKNVAIVKDHITFANDIIGINISEIYNLFDAIIISLFCNKTVTESLSIYDRATIGSSFITLKRAFQLFFQDNHHLRDLNLIGEFHTGNEGEAFIDFLKSLPCHIRSITFTHAKIYDCIKNQQAQVTDLLANFPALTTFSYLKEGRAIYLFENLLKNNQKYARAHDILNEIQADKAKISPEEINNLFIEAKKQIDIAKNNKHGKAVSLEENINIAYLYFLAENNELNSLRYFVLDYESYKTNHNLIITIVDMLLRINKASINNNNDTDNYPFAYDPHKHYLFCLYLLNSANYQSSGYDLNHYQFLVSMAFSGYCNVQQPTTNLKQLIGKSFAITRAVSANLSGIDMQDCAFIEDLIANPKHYLLIENQPSIEATAKPYEFVELLDELKSICANQLMQEEENERCNQLRSKTNKIKEDIAELLKEAGDKPELRAELLNNITSVLKEFAEKNPSANSMQVPQIETANASKKRSQSTEFIFFAKQRKQNNEAEQMKIVQQDRSFDINNNNMG